MFYIVNSNGSTNYTLSTYFRCLSQNCFDFTPADMPSIFPSIFPTDLFSKIFNISIDKVIKFSCQRRMVNAVILSIELDHDCPNYEIEVYCESENKPIQKLSLNNRPTVLIGGLEEDRCYRARIRGLWMDSTIATKWSPEISFYPLKGNIFYIYMYII